MIWHTKRVRIALADCKQIELGESVSESSSSIMKRLNYDVSFETCLNMCLYFSAHIYFVPKQLAAAVVFACHARVFTFFKKWNFGIWSCPVMHVCVYFVSMWYMIHSCMYEHWIAYMRLCESVCPAYCIYLPLTTMPPGSCSNCTELLPPLPSRPSTCDSIIPKPCSTARIQIQIHKLMFLIGTIFYSIACVISSNCVSSSVFVLSWLVTCCIRLTCVIHARLEHDSRRIPQPWFFAVCCCFRERRPEMSAPPPLISLQDDISL